MTTATVRADGDRRGLAVLGHAEGSPQMCAAVSGIVYALAGYLANAAQAGETEIVQWELDSGCAQLDFCGGSGALAAFDMAVIGLRQLEKKCPELVQVETASGGVTPVMTYIEGGRPR